MDKFFTIGYVREEMTRNKENRTKEGLCLLSTSHQPNYTEYWLVRNVSTDPGSYIRILDRTYGSWIVHTDHYEFLRLELMVPQKVYLISENSIWPLKSFSEGMLFGGLLFIPLKPPIQNTKNLQIAHIFGCPGQSPGFQSETLSFDAFEEFGYFTLLLSRRIRRSRYRNYKKGTVMNEL
jgi:hypothetical protein